MGLFFLILIKILLVNFLLNYLEREHQNSANFKHSKDDIVSANDILKSSFNPDDYPNSEIISDPTEVEKYNDIELNNDSDPIVIRKQNNQEIVYKQNVFIRWLQPPTPPPPAPIISNYVDI